MKKLGILIGIAAGYVAAKRLLNTELPDSMPEQLDGPLHLAQDKLRRGRERAHEAIAAAREARAAAEAEMHSEYLRKAGRRR